ncbi:hypothetical protein, partial [Mycobacterium tuberculosis]
AERHRAAAIATYERIGAAWWRERLLAEGPAPGPAPTDVPVLHLHGDADEIIPIAHGRRIASHAKSGNYRFIPIRGGT